MRLSTRRSMSYRYNRYDSMLGDIVSSSTNGACYTQSSRDNVLSSPVGSDIQCSHLIYSNTCVKRVSQKDRKIGYKNNNRLVHVKSIAECSKGGILQYVRPSLSYHLSQSYLFCLVLSGRFTLVLLYKLIWDQR